MIETCRWAGHLRAKAVCPCVREHATRMPARWCDCHCLGGIPFPCQGDDKPCWSIGAWVVPPKEESLNYDATLTAHPGDDRGPIFVVMAPPGLAFLAAPPWRAAQRFRPARLGLSLVSGGVIEVIGFDRPCSLTTELIGQGRIAQPPAPAIACADMDP